MELLIFLSAILTALTGVAGGARAMEPQSVASSGIAAIQAVKAEREAVVSASFPAAEAVSLVVLAPMMPALVARHVPRVSILRLWGRRRE